MVAVKIKGVHIVKRKLANGQMREHVYAWRGGPRMRARPGDPNFHVEHAGHVKAAEKKTVLTLDSLIDHFTGPEDSRNPDFLKLAERTREDHLYAFKLIRKEWRLYL